MVIFTKQLSQLTFKDIEDFCVEKYPEGVELDYKREFPSNLAKTIAAFSNNRGGIVILGVEEDSSTGLPEAWKGVKNDAKHSERVNQIIATVDPTPDYEVHVTDERGGCVFIIVRVFEGYSTPYYVKNDSNIYWRTGNIAKLLDIASPDAVELLFKKREEARKARDEQILLATGVFNSAVSRADSERLGMIAEKQVPAEQSGYYPHTLGTQTSLCTIDIQPYYPRKSLISPSELEASLPGLRVSGHFGGVPPEQRPESIPQGVLFFEWGERTGAIFSTQVSSAGLIHRVQDVLRVDEKGNKRIYLSSVAVELLMVLKFAGNFYSKVGYQGSLFGSLKIKGVQGNTLFPIVPDGWRNWDDFNKALLNEYRWVLDLDTSVLTNQSRFTEFITDRIREIYWSVGYKKINEKLLADFLKQSGLS